MQVSFCGNGVVHYKSKGYECNLYLNKDEGGILLNIFVREALASFVALPLEMDILSGKLSNGYKFTALNVVRSKMNSNVSSGITTFTYEAAHLLEGIGQEQNTEVFNTVEFEIPDIIEWGGISGYKIDETHSLLAENHEKNEVILFQENHLTLKYKVYSDMLPIVESDHLKEMIVLRQHGLLCFNVDSGDTIFAYMEMYEKVKPLLELCLLREVRPIKITAYSDAIQNDYGEFCVPREISIISLKCKKVEMKEQKGVTYRHNWIHLKELQSHSGFENYFKVYENLSPVIELYVELFHSNPSSHRRIFMNLVQALETYHSRMVTNNIGAFKSRVDDIIKNRSEEFKSADRKFLMANSKGFITLESRLADLLLADYSYWFDTGDIKHYDYPNCIAKTRNYYTHYDERIKNEGRVLSEEELAIYNKALFCILEYYLMLSLGFTDRGEIRDTLKMRWGDLRTDLDIKKASEKVASEKSDK